ncbi:mitochondrial mRNA pseudouridine synthase Trub2 isoform X2 [Contarinia nasturtii]|uniref:mitochondrial mRNA pseudouridine synthase Trub2 isoform X2 n=1 Tax=Contarinia nasturtii TaxID=265458 RepID=UPI0012D3EC8D|nr:mitochondrial mRNA pseudouridine synthase Trub2 isoform X2 [Contarinia nasturtii]
MSKLILKEKFISQASEAWRFLHGTINVYKPAGMLTSVLINAVKINICKGLNSLELSEPKPLVQITSADNKNYSIQLVPNLGQDILATGPRYTEKMLRISPADHLGANTSVLGINRGIEFANILRNGAPIQTFQVTGKFGKATDTNFQGAHITTRGSYKHVTKGKLEALLSSLQASYQKQMYDRSGVDIQSQAAYELACKGLIRPANTKETVIYGIRNTEFTRNTFTMEVQAMNASEELLASLVLDIAVQLRTVAHCTKIRCTRYGYFSFEHSLLRSQWNLERILRSMHECQQIWKSHPDMVAEDISSPVGYAEDLQK